MTSKKTLPERERELQALLATPDGKQELQQIASRYEADDGRTRPAKSSIITYLLVYERSKGLIAG